MISEAQELRVKGIRVSHGWCMGIDSDGYGGMSWGREGGGLYACGTMPVGVGRMSGDAIALLEREVIQ